MTYFRGVQRVKRFKGMTKCEFYPFLYFTIDDMIKMLHTYLTSDKSLAKRKIRSARPA